MRFSKLFVFFFNSCSLSHFLFVSILSFSFCVYYCHSMSLTSFDAIVILSKLLWVRIDRISIQLDGMLRVDVITLCRSPFLITFIFAPLYETTPTSFQSPDIANVIPPHSNASYFTYILQVELSRRISQPKHERWTWNFIRFFPSFHSVLHPKIFFQFLITFLFSQYFVHFN